jgi:hypothetical protein
MAEPGKKGALLIALGGPKGPSGHAEPDADEMGGPSDGDTDDMGMDGVKQQAADDAFDALKSDDRALFADALDRYVKACV